ASLKSGPSQAPGRYKAFRPSSARAPSNDLSCIDRRGRPTTARQQMSELFKFPYAFVRHDNSASTTQNSGFYKSAGNENRSAPLRNDHVILWAIDGLLALHAVLVRWRSRRRTFRALADLDEEQLRDVGLTRSHHKS